MNYSNRYYNLFKKVSTIKPPIFDEAENYIMRFNSELSYYPYNGNSLTVIFFKQGFGDLIIDSNKRKISNNEFIIASPNSDWEYINNNNKPIDVLSFVLSEELLAKFNLPFVASEKQLLENPFEIIKKDFFLDKQTFNANNYNSGKVLNQMYNYSNSDDYSTSNANEIAFTVLENIFNDHLKANHLLKKISATKKNTQIEVFKRLLIAYEYINDNINKNITIKELSLVSCLSDYHLFRSFKNVFQKTPHQYINIQKMNKAQELLSKGEFSVSEVSIILNFPDLPTFSKLYKKTYGIPPSRIGK